MEGELMDKESKKKYGYEGCSFVIKYVIYEQAGKLEAINFS